MHRCELNFAQTYPCARTGISMWHRLRTQLRTEISMCPHRYSYRVASSNSLLPTPARSLQLVQVGFSSARKRSMICRICYRKPIHRISDIHRIDRSGVSNGDCTHFAIPLTLTPRDGDQYRDSHHIHGGVAVVGGVGGVEGVVSGFGTSSTGGCARTMMLSPNCPNVSKIPACVPLL